MNFFSRQAIPKTLSVLDFRHPWDTQYQVWFNLDNYLNRRNFYIFENRISEKFDISDWNTNFFSRQTIPKILSVLDFRHPWDTPCQVWFNLDNYLNRRNFYIFENRISEKVDISDWNKNFFSRQTIPKILSVLEFRHPWDTQYQVWFNFDNSLTRRNFYIFENRISEKVDISDWNMNFFSRQAMPKILSVLDFRHPWDTQYQVWFNLDNYLNRRNFYIFENRISEKVDISDWNTNFFSRQTIPKILSVLDSRHPWDTPCQVWFNLDNYLNRRNFYIFENRISEKVDISDWNTNFFSRQTIPKILSVLELRHPWDTPYKVWFNLDNSLTRRNFYIFENRISEKVDISDWNMNFFSRQAMPKILSVLDFRHPWDTQYQVWFNLDNYLNRRNFYIFENRISEKVDISDWNTNFFSRQTIPKILSVLDSRHPWDTPCQVWFNLDNYLNRRNFYIFENRISEKVDISDWNTNFFSRQTIPKILSVLDFRHPWDTQYQVWFNLDNSLTRRNFYIFENRISEKVDISDWNMNFFSRQAMPKNSFCFRL